MTAGRPRKPDHLKVVAGTDQPSRMNPNAPRPSKVPPSPPEYLTVRAAEWFLHVVAILEGMGLASSDHVDLLAMGAMTFDEVMDLTAVIEDTGYFYHVPIFGLFDKDDQPKLAPKLHPAVKARSDAER